MPTLANGTALRPHWRAPNHNVLALADAAGNVVERYAYDPFGAVTVLTPTYGSRSASSYEWNVLWQGMKYDAVSGSYKSRIRTDISPTLGRPFQVDPIGFAAGDVNLYRWEGNNPVRYVDPSGLAYGDWWDPRTAAGVVYHMGEQVVDGGVALVTGRAGEQLGQRAVDIYESQTGQAYTGGAGQSLSVAGNIGTQIIGINGMAEGIAGADTVTGQPLSAMDRGSRGAMGLGQFAGTAAAGAGASCRVATCGRATMEKMRLPAPAGSTPAPSVPYPSAQMPSLLDSARAAREALAAGTGRGSAVYVGAVDRFGRPLAGRSQPALGGGGICAETDAFWQGGVWFTESMGWRGPGRVYQPIPVCPRCQGMYPQSAWPQGAQPAPGGLWTQGRP